MMSKYLLKNNDENELCAYGVSTDHGMLRGPQASPALKSVTVLNLAQEPQSKHSVCKCPNPVTPNKPRKQSTLLSGRMNNLAADMVYLKSIKETWIVHNSPPYTSLALHPNDAPWEYAVYIPCSEFSRQHLLMSYHQDHHLAPHGDHFGSMWAVVA